MPAIASTVAGGTGAETTEVVSKLNRALRGWANYFQVGTLSGAYRALDNYTAPRLRWWLRLQGQATQGRDVSTPASVRVIGLVRLTARGRDQPWAKA